MLSVSRFSEANAKTIVIPMDNLLAFEISVSTGNAGVSPAQIMSNTVFTSSANLTNFTKWFTLPPPAKLPVLGAFLSPDNGGQRGIGALIATTEGLSS